MTIIKDKIGQMVDALINNKPEEAQISFHDYLGSKMKEKLHPEIEVEDEAKTEEDK
jgi:hypothetical protein